MNGFCPFACGSRRLATDPVVLQKFQDLDIEHFISRYKCGSTLEFTRERGRYTTKKPYQSEDCKKFKEAEKWKDKT